MKKYIVAGVLAAAVVAYLIFTNVNNAPSVSVPSVTNTSPAGTLPSSNNNGGGATTSTNPGTSASGYKDGTYTGPVADAFYGNLQVAVTIQGGTITNITYPQYPDAPGHTTEVSNFALPALKQEAIIAQSANVNVVSGATQDSQAFQQSLAAALAQAKS